MLGRALRFLLLFFCLVPAALAQGKIALVISDQSTPYSAFVSQFQDSLRSGNWATGRAIAPDALANQAPVDVVVAVGSEALRAALARNDKTPILATLITRSAFEQITAGKSGDGRKVSAIYLDQPASRQAAFIRLLLPAGKNVGVLARQADSRSLAGMTSAMRDNGLSLVSETSDTDDALIPALNLLLPRVDVLLATPDPVIFRRDNVKAILMTAYRFQRPVIAFSQALVNAGALAALYSSPTQAAEEAADIIREHGINLPPARFPATFSLAINRSVAEALGRELPDEASLRRSLQGAKN
jgi:putative tryptophan/tyrosine transport system substrate-binding protein